MEKMEDCQKIGLVKTWTRHYLWKLSKMLNRKIENIPKNKNKNGRLLKHWFDEKLDNHITYETYKKTQIVRLGMFFKFQNK